MAAEALSEAGYQSLFVATKGVLLPSKGWARGFDRAVSLDIEQKTKGQPQEC